MARCISMTSHIQNMRQVRGSRGGAAAICGVAKTRVQGARRWRRAGSNEGVNLFIVCFERDVVSCRAERAPSLSSTAQR